MKNTIYPQPWESRVSPRMMWSLLLLAALASGGCVSTSTYQRQVDQTATLQGKVQNLTVECETLQQRVRSLADQKEDLGKKLTEVRNKNSSMQQDLTRCGADTDRLEKTIASSRKKATASLAAKQNTIDELTTKNHDLAQQVERERIAREARIAHLKSTFNELAGQMEAEIKQGEVKISDLKGKLTVNLVERILFGSGAAEIKPAGKQILRRVGKILKRAKDKEIRVEGYTDNVPISAELKRKFASNWELSSARATNVVRFLQEQVGIPGNKLAACGFGPYHPIADNSTAKGRAQNRRIRIVLVPLDGKVVKPLGK